MNDWKIRAAVPADAPCIARHRYFDGGAPPDLEAYTAWVSGRIQEGRYVGAVAETRGAIVAGAGAVWLDWGPTRGDPCPWRARVVNVFTAPAWRGLGLARTLLERVIAECRARGLRTFCLAATPDGAALYRSLGFVRYEAEMVLRGGPCPEVDSRP